MTFICRRWPFFIFWIGPLLACGAVDPELRFLENRGQGVGDFYAKSGVDLITVSAGELGFYLYDGKQIEYFHEQYRHSVTEAGMEISQMKLKGQFIRLSFIGATLSAPVKHEKFSDYYNFFKGNDSSQWISHVSAFQRIEYKNLYPGIHWMVTSQGKNLKHEFYVQPFCDPSQVKWKYEGQSGLSIDKNGDLIVKNIFGEHSELKPVCFQWKDGKKVYILAHYVLQNQEVQIVVDESYDVTKELVLDPILIFSTFSGSTADNWGSTATPGERGRLYSSGIVLDVTDRKKLPSTAGVFQENFGRGMFDVAILKYDSAGKNLLYGTYLGGSTNETPHSLVINAKNELLLLGTTSSSDFPTTEGVVQRQFKGGQAVFNNVVDVNFPCDIFVAKISTDGSKLLACTYLGGSDNDGVNAEGSALDKNYGDIFRGDIITYGDTIYLSTVTSSRDFPVSDAGFSTTYKGGASDAIVVSLSQDLKKLNWTNFLGGSETDACHTIQIDVRGNLYVAGGTTSSDFPFSSDAWQKSNKGDVDGWIVLLSKDGRKILHSTYTGTTNYEQVYFLDLDPEGSVFVYGQTNSPSFPVTPGVYNNPGCGQFLQKFDSTLTTLKYSTVFGSVSVPGVVIPNISPTAFLVNDCGFIYMAGWGGVTNHNYWQRSSTRNMSVTSDAYQSTTSGSDFYLCALSADATKLYYATFLGEDKSHTHVDGGTSRFDKAGVVYHAVCAGCNIATGRPSSKFPTTEGAYRRTNGSHNCNNAAFKFDLSLLKANLQTNTPDKLNPGRTSFCLGSTVLFENLSFGGMEYQWVIDNNNFTTKLKEESVSYKFDKAGTYPVRLKAIDNATCAGESHASATITIGAPQGRAGGDKAICLGTSTTLDAFNGVSYEWASEDGKEKYQSSNGSVEISPVKTTTYLVNITDASHCLSSGQVKVKVVRHIDLKWNIEYETSCVGFQPAHIQNLSDSLAGTYIDLGDGNTSQEADFWYNYSKPGVYVVKLKGEREICSNELEYKVPIVELKVPNVFTPGTQDNLNDTFKIMANDLPASQFFKIKLEVVNRQGKSVYQSDDYQNDWTGDGLTGTYYYTIKDAGKFECKGWVQIMQ